MMGGERLMFKLKNELMYLCMYVPYSNYQSKRTNGNLVEINN